MVATEANPRIKAQQVDSDKRRHPSCHDESSIRSHPTQGTALAVIANMDDQDTVTKTTDQYYIEEVTPEEQEGWTALAGEAVEEARPYMPPTDSPVLASGDQGADVATGFGVSPEDAPYRADAPTGDAWIEEEVRRVLREDAATAGLPVDVRVQDGVAVLFGVVSDTDDAELAEAVASRVPGVDEVVDRTEVRPEVVAHTSIDFDNEEAEP